jgi:hypothetical protein
VELDEDRQVCLITRHAGRLLEPPVRLHLLTEGVFAQYARQLADSSEDGDLRSAIGLIYVHVIEEIAADSTGGPLTDVGLERRRFGGPVWFAERARKHPEPSPSTIWPSTIWPSTIWLARRPGT